MTTRRIFFSARCDDAAERLGGYRLIDPSLDAVWDALVRNPFGLPRVESDWYSARYAVTKPFEALPALVWIIVIETGGDVEIDDVEEYENY